MKHFADKKRTFRDFQVGDWVYLKLQPYRQLTASSRHTHKLSPKYYGPFKVLEKIGSVAYKLQLPEQAKIHPVFHVSQLKKMIGANVTIHSGLPSYDQQIVEEPERILARRMAKINNTNTTQALIKWKQRAEEEATWENYWDLVAKFPTFDLETRSNFMGEGSCYTPKRVSVCTVHSGE